MTRLWKTVLFISTAASQKNTCRWRELKCANSICLLVVALRGADVVALFIVAQVEASAVDDMFRRVRDACESALGERLQGFVAAGAALK